MDVHFIDGHTGYLTSVRLMNMVYGILASTMEPTGTNGFHLKFDDTSSDTSIGNDSSSSNNNLTPSGFSIALGAVTTAGDPTVEVVIFHSVQVIVLTLMEMMFIFLDQEQYLVISQLKFL